MSRLWTRKASAIPFRAPEGLAIPDADRLVGPVGARHDQDRKIPGEEQVLEGGVGEHDPQGRHPGGDRRSDRRLTPAPNEDDGPLRGREERPFDVADQGQTAGRLEIPDHEGQGFFLAALAHAQTHDGFVVLAVDGQVKSPQPLDGEHCAATEHLEGPSDGIVPFERPAIAVDQLQMRTAQRAGVGFGVESAVGGGFVFLAAVRAEREAGHRGGGPVVGNGADDREPGAAVGAVDEGVAEPAVGGVEELGQASVASGDVGADLDFPRT